jgi:predicted porin
MKKSLLAVAAIGAFASAAQAQSSVTVYGILDVGYIGSNYNGTSITANANSTGTSTTGTAIQKQNTSAFGQSAESTSRLGFKGSEDLGGGASAIFTVEVAIAPENTASSTSPTGLGQFNRQTFAGLKKTGLGQVTIGTQYTPIFNVMALTDAAGMNNLVGNAVYSTNPQSSTGSYNSGAAPYTGSVSNQSLNVAAGNYTTRMGNTVALVSDRFAGVQAQLMLGQSSTNQTQTGANFAGATGGSNNNTVVGGGLDYIWNKLQVVAAYQQIKSFDPAATTAGTVINSAYAAGTSGSYGLNMLDNQTYAAATYDFGILKAYAQYISRKATSQVDSSYTTTRAAQQIGVKSQLTPVISAYATMGLGNSALYGQSLPKANFRTAQVGVDYYLSKRTNLYVAMGTFNQSSNGAAASSTTGQGIATSGNNYATGIRHTF